jgi:hypothetical protein
MYPLSELDVLVGFEALKIDSERPGNWRLETGDWKLRLRQDPRQLFCRNPEM